MIMNEKLLTHRPTHRVAFRERGIDSVMGLRKTRRTQTDRHYVAFTAPPSHRHPVRLWKSLWMFVCFVSQQRDRRCGSEWKGRRGAELSVFPVTTKRSFLCHTASDEQPLPVHQTSPPGSISRMFQRPSLVSFRKLLRLVDKNQKSSSSLGPVLLSHPELVQMLKLGRSVCCDLNTEELTQTSVAAFVSQVDHQFSNRI